MITVKHRFLNHRISPNTEMLIIGTFNPEVAVNDAEFFYGRSKNFLWRLLPIVFGQADLKDASIQEKLDFIKKYNIDFIDLIEEIQVDEGQEANYYDGYIDNKVTRWADVIALINTLTKLKRVCFTRKSFADIPQIKKQLFEIRKECERKGIAFQALTTPARFYRDDKQTEWTNFLLNGHK